MPFIPPMPPFDLMDRCSPEVRKRLYRAERERLVLWGREYGQRGRAGLAWLLILAVSLVVLIVRSLLTR